MRALKKLVAPASIGFVLSFFISLIATKGNFGHSLLRGIIFALVFALLFFLIDFVFNKFLDGSESVSVSSRPSNESGLGAKVDITLSDEELSDDGVDLKFSVGQNKVGLTQSATDISRTPSKPKTEIPASASSSVVQSAVPSQNIVNSAAPQPSAVTVASSAVQPSGSSESTFKPVALGSERSFENDNGKIGDLDSLPEISDFDSDLGSENEGSSSTDGLVDDSDFAGTNNSLYNRKKPGDEVSSGRDAATLAKAIQTILKREE